MHLQGIGLLVAYAASAVALSTPHKHVSHEKRDAPPKKWVKRETLSRDAILPMRFGLKQSNIENGAGAALMDEL